MNRFKDTYTGRKMLETTSIDECGVWDIYGEDPNCDMGGHHHTPFLERVSGRLEDVIAYAEQLPKFWLWGAGGEIRHYKEKNVKIIPEGWGDKAKQQEREDKARKLQDEIEKLQKELKEL
jgi:hypothetical protein